MVHLLHRLYGVDAPADVASPGRQFQTLGPAAVANERSPTVARRDGRTSSRLVVDDRRQPLAGISFLKPEVHNLTRREPQPHVNRSKRNNVFRTIVYPWLNESVLGLQKIRPFSFGSRKTYLQKLISTDEKRVFLNKKKLEIQTFV